MVYFYNDTGDKSFTERLIESFHKPDEHYVKSVELDKCMEALKSDNSLMDLRFLQQHLGNQVNYCDEATINEIHELIQSIKPQLAGINKDIIYLFLLPESSENDSSFVIESLFSSLNTIKGYNFSRVPLTLHSYWETENTKIAYSFYVLPEEVLEFVKRKAPGNEPGK